MQELSERELRNGIIQADGYNIHYALESLRVVGTWLENYGYSQILVVTDTHTRRDCYPLLAPHLPEHALLTIPAGEPGKVLAHCEQIWARLTEENFDRRGIVLNLGGGMVGDLGGFAAATFKRGLRFVQVPTSLLAMCDASVGGKTGVNFRGYKNQVGAFADPSAVFLFRDFLKTLREDELRSGFAEMIKHSLIADAAAFEEFEALQGWPENWDPLIARSVQIKLHIVQEDPRETGMRKALNFGHTIGHAIESVFLEKEGNALRHGEAVALGMAAEAWISHDRGRLDNSALERIATCLRRYFRLPDGGFPLPLREAILALSLQDKKNEGGEVRMTLLDDIGGYAIDQAVTVAEMDAALQATERMWS